MTSWADIADADPDFAARVEKRFDAYRHKVLATLRKDGSPRISGIEATFKDGELWLGMMEGSLKARDLRRDPRLALHSGTEDPDAVAMTGVVVDAKVAGRAVEIHDEETLRAFRPDASDADAAPNFHLFRVDLEEVVLIAVGDPSDHLLIETWRPGRGLVATKRY